MVLRNERTPRQSRRRKSQNVALQQKPNKARILMLLLGNHLWRYAKMGGF